MYHNEGDGNHCTRVPVLAAQLLAERVQVSRLANPVNPASPSGGYSKIVFRYSEKKLMHKAVLGDADRSGDKPQNAKDTIASTNT